MQEQHPHAVVSSICSAAKIPLYKGLAAKIYAKCKSVDKDVVLAYVAAMDGDSKREAADRRAWEATRKADRQAASERVDAILPEAVARHTFRDPATVTQTVRKLLANRADLSASSDIDGIVAKAVDEAYALDRAQSAFPDARKRAKEAEVMLLSGEPAAASIIGCAFDLDRWLAARIEDELRLMALLPDPKTLLDKKKSPLFVQITCDADAAPYLALQSALRGIRSGIPPHYGEADVVVRSLALRGSATAKKSKIDDALKARQSELKELRRRLDEWDRSLVNAPDAREALGATPTEFSRWVGDGRISVGKVVPFWKWGQSLTANYFDPALFAGIRETMPKWREQHAENVKNNRKKAALAAAGHDTRNVGDSSLALVRRLKSLAKNADIDGVAVVSGKTLPELVHPYAFEVVLALTAEAEATCAASVVLSTPLGPDETAAVTAKAPRGKARAQAVALLEQAAAKDRVHVAEALAAVAQAWRTRALDASTGYPPEALPRIAAAMADHLRRFEADGPVERIQGMFRDALHRSIDAGMKVFLRRERVAKIRERTGLADYPALFPAARSMGRRLVLHVGPTNSGKTHTALDTLAAAPSGVYAAPLRLMALEAHDRLNGERGVPCSMVTGEEVIEVEGARHVSCTIETADFERLVDVAVIDEIQMLGDAERGWAWTAALVGLPAKTVVMTGSFDAIPRVEAIAAMTGDELEIKTFERLNPLAVEDVPRSLSDVGEGDAVIAFSRREILRLREALQDSGKKVSVVYGALGPEVRRAEAKRFREGDSNVLVASDAVGMGLNLPCRRVLFTALEKFDGFDTRPLTDSEIRQIAGRAGRHGHHEGGFVGVIGKTGLSRIKEALARPPDPPADVRPYVMPPFRAVLEIADQQKTTNLRAILLYFANTVLDCDPCLQPAYMAPALAVADCVDTSKLDLRTRFGYLGVPLDTRSGTDVDLLREMAKKHATNATFALGSNKPRDAPTTHEGLERLEARVKTLSMYIWLATKWPATFTGLEPAAAERASCNGLIETALRKSFLHRSCRECGARLPRKHGFAICEDCHSDRRHHRDDYY